MANKKKVRERLAKSDENYEHFLMEEKGKLRHEE